MEGLENVTELIFTQPVQMSHNCIEFMNHVVLLILFDGAALHVERLSPFRESRTRRGQPARQCHGGLPQGARARWSRDREWVEDMIVQVNLDEPSRIPVQAQRGQHP